MNISIKKSGGFAGITEDLGTIDTAKLGAGAARQVEQTVREIGFFDLPGTISGGVGADLFRYEITVMDGDREHTVTFEDDGSPETAPLRSLVDFLSQMG